MKPWAAGRRGWSVNWSDRTLTESRREPVSVLVTAIGGAGYGEQILKALRLAGGYRIVGADSNRDCANFALVDHAVTLPKAADPDAMAAAHISPAMRPRPASRPAGESGRSVMQRAVGLLLHYPRAGAVAAEVPGLETVDAPGADLLRRLLEIATRSPDITTGQLIETFRDDPDSRWIERLARDEPLDDEAAAPGVLRDSLKRLVERHRRKAEVDALRSRRGPTATP